MSDSLIWAYYAFNGFIFIYAVSVSIFYLAHVFFAFKGMRRYKRRKLFFDEQSFMSSDFIPPLSILAPAYNESATVVDNIRSLFSLNYPNLEIIVINDGSKDDTLQKCINTFQLVKVDFAVQYKVASNEIKAVYKSENPAFRRLVVVDKVNGGKADALNAGINILSHEYFASIDVDCIIQQDAFIHMMRPFMDSQKRVIATGGVVRIANECEFLNGNITQVRLPKAFLPRHQVVEYLRAFLMGRMAWAEINGLMLISGAFGVFDKAIVMAVGGYNKHTVGEDMELVVRMRKHMHQIKEKYEVAFVPEPLCWTEAPMSYKIFSRQRNRWTRGTIETLWTHKDLFLNPKYGVMGLISYPFWFLFEWLAPILEFSGIFLILAMTYFGLVNWYYFGLFLTLVYTFAIFVTTLSLAFEEFSFPQYRKLRYISALIFTVLTEPFVYHILNSWNAIKGNWDLWRGKKNWGEMTRTGFSKPQS
ncbi:glycosyltransferase family 2 protein [bacterium]|nr:MAG: glycosyltransferase family 2 protein [bacterium]